MPGYAAFALRYLGFCASAVANFDTARILLEDSLAVAHRMGSRIDVATALMYLADVIMRDDRERSWQLPEESSRIFRDPRHDGLGVSTAPPRLARVLAVRYSARGAPGCRELRNNRDGGELIGVAAALVTIGSIAQSCGIPPLAVEMLGKADALAESVGGQLLPFDAKQFELESMRTHELLDRADWIRAWERGRVLSLGQQSSWCGRLWSKQLSLHDSVG